MSRPVLSAHAHRDARQARLTPAEWVWTYNGLALAPVFTAAVLALGWIAERTASPLPTLLLVWVAVWGILLAVRTLDGPARVARREQAVLTRPLRDGRHVWAVPDGDRVRVYRIAEEPTRIPGAWPLVLGHRAHVADAREFDVDDESEDAHRFAAEAERQALPQPGARGLARVLNERR